MQKIDSITYKLFFGGVLVGVTSSLFIVVFFLRGDGGVFEKEKNDQQIQKLPQFGESGYDPEVFGYISLIGTVKTISPEELVFTSSWCLKPGCDSTKNHIYRATIVKETILKRLTRKNQVELTRNAQDRKQTDAPPNPFNEQPLKIETVKAGENVTVLIKEIINDTTTVAHEISIFEPLVP